MEICQSSIFLKIFWCESLKETATFTHLTHLDITTYAQKMTNCHCLLDTLANGVLIRYDIKVKYFITTV